MTDANPNSCFCLKLKKPKPAAADKIETSVQDAIDNAMDNLAVAINVFMEAHNFDAPTQREKEVFEWLREHNLVPKDGTLDLAQKRNELD